MHGSQGARGEAAVSETEGEGGMGHVERMGRTRGREISEGETEAAPEGLEEAGLSH